MMRKALGKGISALIPETKEVRKSEVVEIDIKDILTSSDQPRQSFDASKLKELASSIKQKGVIQPIIVQKRGGKFHLIAGERRLRAVKSLGMNKIPAIVKEIRDDETLEISLIENIQRDDLNPIEEATAYERIMSKGGLTQEEVAERVGKDRATVANVLRLLKLPDEIKNYIAEGRLSMGHGKTLLSLGNSSLQKAISTRIINEGLSVRQVESIVSNELLKKRKQTPLKTARKDPNMSFIEKELQKHFGTKVIIKVGRKKKTIEIEFYSNEDLQRILEVIKVRID